MVFQPIIDTSGHELVGHECVSLSPEEFDWSAIAASNSRGLYFVSVPRERVANSMRELRVAGLRARDIVFQMEDADSSGILVREHGAALALHSAGASSFQRICDVRPDYIKLDPALTRNAEDPVCACTIRKIVEVAEKCSARTIATGVDRLRMMENLWLLGIEIMQGDLLGRPAPDVIRTSRDLVRLSIALEPIMAISVSD